MIFLQRVQPVRYGLHAAVEALAGIVPVQTIGDAADRALDIVHPAFELGLGQAHFKPSDGIFQAVQRLFVLGGAALVFHLVGGALIGGCFDLLERVVQCVGIELGGLLHRRQPRIHGSFGGLEPLIQRPFAQVGRVLQRPQP